VGRLQQPALVLENDAVFTDDDFEHIRTLDLSRCGGRGGRGRVGGEWGERVGGGWGGGRLRG
jgi:hypothetical protein